MKFLFCLILFLSLKTLSLSTKDNESGDEINAESQAELSSEASSSETNKINPEPKMTEVKVNKRPLLYTHFALYKIIENGKQNNRKLDETNKKLKEELKKQVNENIKLKRMNRENKIKSEENSQLKSNVKEVIERSPFNENGSDNNKIRRNEREEVYDVFVSCQTQSDAYTAAYLHGLDLESNPYYNTPIQHPIHNPNDPEHFSHIHLGRNNEKMVVIDNGVKYNYHYIFGRNRFGKIARQQQGCDYPVPYYA